MRRGSKPWRSTQNASRHSISPGFRAPGRAMRSPAETWKSPKTPAGGRAGARVLLAGLGDLGRRLAAHLAGLAEVGELVLAGRAAAEGPAFAALLAACGNARVRFAPLDAGDEGATEQLLRRERPDFVVQCATLLSPWALSGRSDPAAAALLRAGFALQLPAQIVLLRTLLRAAATAGLSAPVVNASSPDLTHPILATEGLSPLVGIGNAGMILARVRAALRSAARQVEPVRVLAHHA